jgi:hypothetical protein
MNTQDSPTTETNKINSHQKTAYVAMGLVVGAAITALYNAIVGPLIFPANQIPNVSEVKKGFVPPSDISLRVQDVNLDGKRDETTFIYQDPKTKEQTTYFLKFEEDRPSTSDAITATYTTRPKIVPIEIREGR